jgi:hypothetical protein
MRIFIFALLLFKSDSLLFRIKNYKNMEFYSNLTYLYNDALMKTRSNSLDGAIACTKNLVGCSSVINWSSVLFNNDNIVLIKRDILPIYLSPPPLPPMLPPVQPSPSPPLFRTMKAQLLSPLSGCNITISRSLNDQVVEPLQLQTTESGIIQIPFGSNRKYVKTSNECYDKLLLEFKNKLYYSKSDIGESCNTYYASIGVPLITTSFASQLNIFTTLGSILIEDYGYNETSSNDVISKYFELENHTNIWTTDYLQDTEQNQKMINHTITMIGLVNNLRQISIDQTFYKYTDMDHSLYKSGGCHISSELISKFNTSQYIYIITSKIIQDINLNKHATIDYGNLLEHIYVNLTGDDSVNGDCNTIRSNSGCYENVNTVYWDHSDYLITNYSKIQCIMYLFLTIDGVSINSTVSIIGKQSHQMQLVFPCPFKNPDVQCNRYTRSGLPTESAYCGIIRIKNFDNDLCSNSDEICTLDLMNYFYLPISPPSSPPPSPLLPPTVVGYTILDSNLTLYNCSYGLSTIPNLAHANILELSETSVSKLVHTQVTSFNISSEFSSEFDIMVVYCFENSNPIIFMGFVNTYVNIITTYGIIDILSRIQQIDEYNIEEIKKTVSNEQSAILLNLHSIPLQTYKRTGQLIYRDTIWNTVTSTLQGASTGEFLFKNNYLEFITKQTLFAQQFDKCKNVLTMFSMMISLQKRFSAYYLSNPNDNVLYNIVFQINGPLSLTNMIDISLREICGNTVPQVSGVNQFTSTLDWAYIPYPPPPPPKPPSDPPMLPPLPTVKNTVCSESCFYYGDVPPGLYVLNGKTYNNTISRNCPYSGDRMKCQNLGSYPDKCLQYFGIREYQKLSILFKPSNEDCIDENTCLFRIPYPDGYTISEYPIFTYTNTPFVEQDCAAFLSLPQYTTSGNGVCEDGGNINIHGGTKNSETNFCRLGGDCLDCGVRYRPNFGTSSPGEYQKFDINTANIEYTLDGCDDSCIFHSDGICDEPTGAAYSKYFNFTKYGTGNVPCDTGTDCSDCTLPPSPPPTPPPSPPPPPPGILAFSGTISTLGYQVQCRIQLKDYYQTCNSKLAESNPMTLAQCQDFATRQGYKLIDASSQRIGLCYVSLPKWVLIDTTNVQYCGVHDSLCVCQPVYQSISDQVGRYSINITTSAYNTNPYLVAEPASVCLSSLTASSLEHRLYTIIDSTRMTHFTTIGFFLMNQFNLSKEEASYIIKEKFEINISFEIWEYDEYIENDNITMIPFMPRTYLVENIVKCVINAVQLETKTLGYDYDIKAFEAFSNYIYYNDNT